MASGKYLKGIEQQGLGNINLESDTLKLYPMATTHTFDFTNDQFVSDIIAEIAAGASPITLSSVTYNIASGEVRFDCADPATSGVTFTSNKFIIADTQSGVDATSPLIAGFDNANGTASPLGSTYTVTVPANGLYADQSS